ncbi:MAG: hypothetical protein ACOX87_11860, partial [Chloroflexota bacterium]
DPATGHRHGGSGEDGRKVRAVDLDVATLTASKLIRANSGGTALESSPGIYAGFGSDADVDLQSMQFVNEILGWPAYVPNGTDLVSGNLWLRKSGTMGAVTVVDVSGEAGLTDDYEQAIKALPAAANDAIEWLPWIYANEPRVKAGKTISAMFAVWCVGGVGVTAKLVNSDASETTAPAVNTAEWNIVTIEGHTLAGTSCKPQFVADDAGTFYVVPLGACIGPRAMALPPRPIRYVIHPQDSVISNVDPGGAWVDADLTSKTSPLTVAVKGAWAYQNDTTSYVAVKARPKGAPDGWGWSVVKAMNTGQYWTAQATIPCDDGQTIQFIGGAAGDTEKIGLHLTGYWEWA